MSNLTTRLPDFLRPVDRLVTPEGVAPRASRDLLRAIVCGERYVVSRSLLHFERIERPAGELDQRIRNAVKLAARTRAPYNNPGLDIHWSKRHALVWSWDQDRLQQMGLKHGAWIRPEPMMTAYRDLEDGFHLRQLRDGYEGFVIQNQDLVASRFWRHEPSGSDLDMFQRSCRAVHDDAERQSLDSLSLLRAETEKWASRLTPLQISLVGLLVLGVPLLYQAGIYLRLNLELQGSRQELTAVVQESATHFEALRTYQNNLAQLEEYSDVLNLVHPLLPAAELAETAQTIGGELSRFRVTQNGVEAELRAPDSSDPAEIVRQVEASQSMTGVSISRTRAQNMWAITAELETPAVIDGNSR